MPYEFLPTLNALLNATSGVLVLTGYVFIRRGRIAAHRACMLSAVTASVVFLTSYLIYHYHHGATRFPGAGWARPAYFIILFSHTILAVTIVPFVVITLRRALKGQFDRHRRIARWTFPMWVYVSATGVIVYLILYQVYGVQP
jgi:uncharacterized membrane protein YozB (DUF420 family)